MSLLPATRPIITYLNRQQATRQVCVAPAPFRSRIDRIRAFAPSDSQTGGATLGQPSVPINQSS
jgi:hypothetical protein